MSSRWRRMLWLLGALVLAVFVWRAGPKEILESLGRLPLWALLLLPLPQTCVYVCDTLGWAFAFRSREEHRLRFRALFRIRLIGESLNNVVPPGFVSGEPIKIYLAHRNGAPLLATASSVVLAKTTMTLAQVAFIALATLAAATLVPPNSREFMALLALAGGSFFAVLLLFWMIRRGLFSTCLSALKKIGLTFKTLETKSARFAELDRRVATFARDHRPRFLASTAWHLAGWLLGTIEVWFLLRQLGHPVGWTEALAIEAFAHVAKGLGLFIPGSLGVQESGIVLLFHVLRLPEPLAVTYALLRRAREVFFALVGALLLFLNEGGLGTLQEHQKNEVEDSA